MFFIIITNKRLRNSRTKQQVVLCLIIISIFIYCFRFLIIAILYSHNPANYLIATFLTGFLVALPFSMASSYLAIGFYSMKDTKKVLLGNTTSTVLSVLVCLYFKNLGMVSLMYGIIAYYVTSSTMYAIMYKRANFLKNSQNRIV